MLDKITDSTGWHWKLRWAPLSLSILKKRPPAWIAIVVGLANLLSFSWAKNAVFVGIVLIVLWNMRVRHRDK